MKKPIFLLYLFFVMFATNAVAQNSSLLWKVESDNHKNTSYLFGTIHLICTEDFKFFPDALEALQKTDQLVLEIDFSDPELPVKMQQMAFNPTGENIASKLEKHQAEAVNLFFTKYYNMDLTQLGLLRPFALTTMAMQSLTMCEKGLDSYEQYLMSLASEHDLDVDGLETLEYQMSLFDNIPEQEQIDMLYKLIDSPHEGIEQFEKMIDSYFSQDIEEMYRTFVEDEDFGIYQDEIIHERNRNWIPKMSTMMNERTVFFAFGAAHLAGDKGVINLLREQGYKVTMIGLKGNQ